MVARKAKLTYQIEAELHCSMPLTFEEQVSNRDHKHFPSTKHNACQIITDLNNILQISNPMSFKNTIHQLSKVGGKIASIAGFASYRNDTAATEPRLEPSQAMEKNCITITNEIILSI